MKYKILTLIFTLVIVSCNLTKEKRHAAVIPEQKFISILVDYHLAQGFSSSISLRHKFKNYKTVNLTDSVLLANGCTRAVFDSTLSYYSRDVDKFQAIYEKVIDELNKMEAKAKDKKIKPEKKGIHILK
jgi:hypothetical protein